MSDPALPPRSVLQAGAGQFSLAQSIGGVRGVLESVLPFLVFSIAYAVTTDLRTSVIAALVPAVILTVWRLLAREPLTQAISGLIGVGLGAFVASRTDNAADFFLPSILKNAGFAVLYAVSALIRWPLIGVVLGAALGEGTAWRADRARYSAYRATTWLWAAMFGIRLAVQVPLYLAGAVALLGTLNAKVLGLPLFGLTLWLSWLIIRRVPTTKPLVDRINRPGDELSPPPPAEASGASAAPPHSPAR